MKHSFKYIKKYICTQHLLLLKKCNKLTFQNCSSHFTLRCRWKRVTTEFISGLSAVDSEVKGEPRGVSVEELWIDIIHQDNSPTVDTVVTHPERPRDGGVGRRRKPISEKRSTRKHQGDGREIRHRVCLHRGRGTGGAHQVNSRGREAE